MNDHGNNSAAVITVKDLFYSYQGNKKTILNNINFSVKKGEFISILGANGSGKSTLLSCLNGSRNDYTGTIQIALDSGRIISPSNRNDILELRQFIGTILQNPDDQIISSVSEEDVAFGPENLGLPKEEIKARVKEALRFVDLEHKASTPPQYLSGGELQRLCIAGVLAMKSRVLLLDEASSMLDKKYRGVLHTLLKDYTALGNTVIQVTHNLEESMHSDRCVILNEGSVVFDGPPRDLLAHPSLHSWGFRLPEAVKTLQRCRREFPGFSFEWSSSFDPEEFASYLYDYLGEHENLTIKESTSAIKISGSEQFARGPFPLVFESAGHEYHPGTSFAAPGIKDVTVRIPAKAKVAVIGHSGAGKSTLLKHMNALLLPDKGNVFLMGQDVFDKNTSLKSLRKKIALGIQNPEIALFEKDVASDVAYGPENNGVTGEKLRETVKSALEEVGLPYDEYASREIRTLSGGEKRRTALAGVFALESDVVVLDEPASALDGKGQEQVFSILENLRGRGNTVIFTSHSSDDVCDCDFVALMNQGELIRFAPPRDVFGDTSGQEQDLAKPWIVDVFNGLTRRGFPSGPVPLSSDELFYTIQNYMDDKKEVPGASIDGRAEHAFRVFDKIPGAVPEDERRKKTGLEFFDNASFGQFMNIPSPMRNAPGGLKLAALLVFSILTLICPSPVILSSFIVFVLILSYFAGHIKPLHLLRGFIPAIPFIIIIILFQFLFSWPGDESRVLLTIGPINVTVEEIRRSVMLILRLVSIMVLLSLYTAITPLRETLRAIKKGLAPLKVFRFPVKDFSLSIGISLRFVPVLTDEAQRVVSAQLSRGGGYEGKGRIAAAIPLIVPLFIRSLERCTKLAYAMEMRLYTTDAGGQDKIRKIAAGGMLSAVVIVLGLTRLGLIPWFAGVSLTIMHTPVIIGAILEGPLVGMFIGFVFGIFSLMQSAISPAGPLDAAFVNPLISVLPRMLIGPVSWLIYTLFSGQFRRKTSLKQPSIALESLGITAGAIAGSLTNTILVLSELAIFGFFPWPVVITAAIANGPPEAVAAAIVVLAVVTAWKRIPRRKKRKNAL